MDNIITMTEKEARKYDVIRSLCKGEITAQEASVRLDITKRHAKRLKKRVQEDGVRGVVHTLRGKKSNRALPDAQEKRIIAILKKEYPSFRS